MAKSFHLLLKFVTILLALFWVSVWVMKPTRIWTRKWKEAEDAARTTVIGSNGNIELHVISNLKFVLTMFLHGKLTCRS